MSGGEIRFKAFISYCHDDERVAAWLHRALERYPIPRSLRGQDSPAGPIGRRLYPIFRDREELSSSGDLSASIRAALDRSDALIVVCSPAAARSRWVNEEILAFKRLGRQERIFAAIAGGEPNAAAEGLAPSLECFPPALRYALGADGELTDRTVEPLAADLRPGGDGRKAGRLKLVAGLLGIRYDLLRRRDYADRRRRIAIRGAAGVAIAAAFVALMLVASWYGLSRPNWVYATSLSFDGDTVRLIGPLTPAQAFRRENSLEILRLGRWGRIESARAVNGLGECAVNGLNLVLPPLATTRAAASLNLADNQSPRPCHVTFTYERDVLPSAVVRFEISDQRWRPVAEVTLTGQNRQLEVKAAGLLGLPPGLRARLNFYSKDGTRLHGVQFAAPNDVGVRPLPVYGDATEILFDYDDATGQVSRLSFKRADGRPAASGLAVRTELRFTRMGGRSEFRYAYDQDGRLLTKAGFSVLGAADWDSGLDPPGIEYRYDADGNLIEEVFTGVDSRIAADRDGAAGNRYRYQDGLLREYSVTDVNGDLAVPPWSECPVQRFEYDARGRQSSAGCFAETGQPKLRATGEHAFRYRYYPDGAWWLRETLDENGRLIADPLTGVAQVRHVLDAFNTVTQEAYLGADDRPTPYRGIGASRIDTRYDRKGRVAVERRYDAQGRLRLDPIAGYATYRAGYSAVGERQWECLYDADDRLLVVDRPRYGYACERTVAENRPDGTVAASTFFEDAAGRLMVNRFAGYAAVETVLTADGRLLRRSWLDDQGELIARNPAGVARQENILDDFGRLAAIGFYGADGYGGQYGFRDNPECGFALVEFSYDDQDGQLAEVVFRAADGRLTGPHAVGAAVIRRVSAESGRLAYEVLDTEGRPALNSVATSLVNQLEGTDFAAAMSSFMTARATCPFPLPYN
ncbi:MAG: TIR domain-containing protein [Dongiaceae bacterium]